MRHTCSRSVLKRNDSGPLRASLHTAETLRVAVTLRGHSPRARRRARHSPARACRFRQARFCGLLKSSHASQSRRNKHKYESRAAMIRRYGARCCRGAEPNLCESLMRDVRRILVAVEDPNSRSLPAVAKAAQLARAYGADLPTAGTLIFPPSFLNGASPVEYRRAGAPC